MRILLGLLLVVSVSASAKETDNSSDAKATANSTVAMTAAEVAATVAENTAAEKASAKDADKKGETKADAKTDKAAVTADAKTEEQTPIVSQKESEIPLNLDAPKKSGEDSHPFFKFLLAISLMGIVATGAYFFFRKYSKTNFAAGKHNQIKVLTQHYLGPKKSLAIIRVAGESILVGITDHNISMIKSLSLMDDELPDHTPNDFSGLMQEEGEQQNVAFNLSGEDEEFSIRGIKDVVSKRLKGMRSIQ